MDESLAGRGLQMVPMLEIAFLVACTALGLWWFRRTNLYRAHRRSGVDPSQFGDTNARHKYSGYRGYDHGPEGRPPQEY